MLCAEYLGVLHCRLCRCSVGREGLYFRVCFGVPVEDGSRVPARMPFNAKTKTKVATLNTVTVYTFDQSVCKREKHEVQNDAFDTTQKSLLSTRYRAYRREIACI